MKKHLNFKLDIPFFVSLLILLAIIPCSIFLPKQYGFENGLFENLQMICLLLCCILTFKAKEHKKFFIFLLLFLIILILREVNCGRTLFFPKPGLENAFYSWKEIPYGWLAHPIYGIYIGITVLYGLINKIYKDIWEFLTKTNLPVWHIIFFVLGFGLSLIAEKATTNFIFEEMAELLMYSGIFGIIYTYALGKYEKL